MGGTPKGLLRAPDGRTLLERLHAEVELALPNTGIVLVGHAEPYRNAGLTALQDAPPGVGPLGGLRALLLEAEKRGHTAVLSLACDLPYVEAASIRRLALDHPEAVALAPRSGSRWEPLFARYSSSALPALDAALAAGDHALQAIFDRLGEQAVPLALSTSEWATLRDWDTPEDIASAPKKS